MKHTKWKYNKSEIINNEYGYCGDVYKGDQSTIDTDICQVWGKDEKECNDRLKLINKAPEMYEALKEITSNNWNIRPETVNNIVSLLKEIEK